MQLKNVQINGFGKLEDVNVNIKPGLNLLAGENESGKSTFMAFIKAIFYGVNKNKAGKMYSDFEKHKPWNEKNFSGKLTYSIGEEEFVAYRDFNRNNAKIYDKHGNEITSEFNKDKSRGAEIGVAHLGMDEETFINSIFIGQKEIKINEASQTTILQKLTNMVQSGDEEVSYQTTIKKLEKILFEEVGTERTQNKPKNILKRELAELEIEKSKLINNRLKHEEIERKLKLLKEKEKQNNKELESAIKVFNIKNKYEKITQEQKAEFEMERKIKEEQNEKLKKETNKKKLIDTTLIIVGAVVLTLAFAFIQEWILMLLTIIIGIVSTICNLKFSYKEELQATSDNFDVVSEEVRKKEVKEIQSLEKENIKKIFTERRIPELKSIIENAEKRKTEILLEEHKLKIEDEALNESLTTLTEVEEVYSYKIETMQEINKKEESINFALKALEEAYVELREEIIPNVEKDIEKAIALTTNGEYTRIKYNDEDGLVIENHLGVYINADKLSVGTIDQIYLGFRMAIAEKYEKLPMIFDEAFVYCDDVRLGNLLKTLYKISDERQIIIASCSDREQRCLEEMGIEFNRIKL